MYILIFYSFLCEIENYAIFKTYVNKNEVCYIVNNIKFIRSNQGRNISNIAKYCSLKYSDAPEPNIWQA